MIQYLIGDATQPIQKPAFITHIVNDIGAWGSGFVLAVSKRWWQPEKAYRTRWNYQLGSVDYVEVDEADIIVCNLVGQHGIGFNDGPPVRYEAIEAGLTNINFVANLYKATIHMPRMGAGLAGGNWEKIEKIIEKTCTVPVFVYDLPDQPWSEDK